MVRTITQNAAMILAFALLFTVSNAHSASLPLTGGGASVFVDFNNPNAGKLFIVGGFPSTPNLNLNGLTVSVNVSGFMRSYTLNAQGVAVGTPDLFELHDSGSGFVFSLNSLYDNVLTTFSGAGVANVNASAQPITLNESITFNGNTYSANITGTFDAVAGKNGRLFLGVITPPPNPLKPPTRFFYVRANPNPTVANTPVKITATISLNNFTGPNRGELHFGDFTPPLRVTGSTFAQMLKSGVSHTYTADGVYTARLTIVGPAEVAETHIYVIVGKGYVVNSRNGAISRLTKMGGGVVNVDLGVANIPGASNAQTMIMDRKGSQIRAPQMGLTIGNTFTIPGIYVAESWALNGSAAMVGKVRKTIAISAADIASSMVSQHDSVGSPRDANADAAITFTNMTGKFLFTSTSADKVIFNGTFTLPAGYMPKNPLGNDIQVSLGTVIDSVHLNEKGKFVGPSANGYMTRYRLTVPKLPNGVATGTETAKISMTMNTSNLDIQGFDAEGITVSVRADETGQTSVARFIQVDMLVGSMTFSVLAEVSFATSTSSDFGTISGRSSK
ncbi:MAG: hypothetical protein WCT04_12310 [Planctomycetota bacterium]